MRRRHTPSRRLGRAGRARSAPQAPPPESEAERLAEEAGTLRRRLAAAESRIRELDQLNSTLISGLGSVRADLERVDASRAWRWGHSVSLLGRRMLGREVKTAGAVRGAIERIDYLARASGLTLPGARADVAELPAARRFDAAAVQRAQGVQRQALARELRGRLGPGPAPRSWPQVSIVVLSHDGQAQLQTLLDGLRESTDYPAFDVTAVDNGSPSPLAPDLHGLARARLVRNEANRTFAQANNHAAADSTGELLLFLNDDVEVFQPDWLTELVAVVLDDGVGAAGATLLHVAHDRALTGSGWIVQHRGIRLRLEDQLPRAYNDCDGDDLFDERFGRETSCPAVTAAALLVRRSAFDEVGGFSDGYRFGTEDVDLGLKLVAAGWDVRCCGRSIAFHRESLTQAVLSRAEVSENRALNRRLFQQRWGPRLRREVRSARLHGDPYWTPDRAHFGITLTTLDAAAGWGDWYTAHELGNALEALGLRVTYLGLKDDLAPLPDDLDVVVDLLDRYDAGRARPSVIVAAWVRNWAHRWIEQAWFWRANLLLASSQGIAEVLEREGGRPSLRFPLATNPSRFAAARPDRDLPRSFDYVITANRWGVERELERALAPEDGHRFAIYGKGWDEVDGLSRYHHGEAGYERLASVYADARIVLDDTAAPTLPYGALNARVFDALAGGALVATNCQAGARELFDDEFPVWSSSADLRTLLDGLLADEPRRSRLVRRYRARVLEAHTYEHRAQQLAEAIAAQQERLSFVIRIGAPDRERAQRWGDLHFAEGIQRELVRRGHDCLIQVLSEWEELEGCMYDVAITLRGLSRHSPRPGQFNLLWSISHPDSLDAAECEGYDLIAVASPTHAGELAAWTSVPVFVLEQATDPRRFYPDPDLALAHDVVFVGNSRGVGRHTLDWLLSSPADVAVWGEGWEGVIDPARLVAEHVANDQLRRVYSSARLVLADHWEDMRRHGYVSNRIYDALASGTMVVSDSVAGIELQFGDAVAACPDRDTLLATVTALLSDDSGRTARAARGREAVLQHHTFERRVDTLLERVLARREQLGFRLRVRPAA